MAIREFVPIGLQPSEIEKPLGSEGRIKDVMIMSLKPMLYGFWSSALKTDDIELDFISKGDLMGKVEGSIHEVIPVHKGYFLLWAPEKTKLKTLTAKQKWWELPKILRQSRKGKFHFNKSEIAHLTAGYFYPRKIYVVIVATKDYLNVFPMDLHLKDADSEAYAFGLQVTNVATSKIEETRKIIVCELGAKSLEMAYSLGKNHGRTNLFGTTLPYECTPSEHFGLPVPEFALGYREVEIEHCKYLGSHMLFLGRVVHEKLPLEKGLQPYHIHRFYHDFLIRKGLLTPVMELEVP